MNVGLIERKKARIDAWVRLINLLAEGFSNKELSEALGKSERTVKWYIGELMKEAGLHGLADERRLIVWAIKKVEESRSERAA